MNKTKFLFFLLISLILYSCSISTPGKELTYVEGGDIRFSHTGIELQFDKKMNVLVNFREKTLNNTPKNEENWKPSHFIMVGGKEIKDFDIKYEELKTRNIETVFGKGKSIVLTGVNEQPEGITIAKTLSVEFYEKYPNTALITASYKNIGSSEFTIEKEFSNYFYIDLPQEDTKNEFYDLWSFQGASVAWGMDYVKPIEKGFEQENWMGVQPDTKTGGGIPFVNLWNRDGGLAIAHIETKPQLVSFPVEVEDKKRVSMSIQKDLNQVLAPGDNYESIRGAIIAHSLDYFDPLETYSNLLADQGIKQKKPSDEAHEAIWCGWGYLTDFTPSDIYQTLPKLKEMDLSWVVIDDRWWDKYGDWNPRDYTFPEGEKQIKSFVDSLHKKGFKVKIWWAPTPVQPREIPTWGGSVEPGMAKIAIDHPEWLIMDETGEYPRDVRDMYQFCPAVPEVQDYMKELTTRFIKDWGFDGHKLDAYYVVPPCFNPSHHHKHPEESYQELPKLLEIIYNTSKTIKPYSVTELCNCGTTQDFFQSIYTDQPVVSDPTTVEQSRRRMKSMKALWGANAPIYADHVEHIRLEADMNDKSDTARVGEDFATQIGTGGVIGTKFTWPGGPENMQLTGEREKHWKKWINLSNKKELSKGAYLNLYDIIYDSPESHVIKKGDSLYYAFYAKNWQGLIELRGLQEKKYKVFDYVNQKNVGTVTGPIGHINVT